MRNKTAQKGFTLIELLLYISISSVMLLTVSLFLNTLLESRIKSKVIAEVESQGTQAMYTILQNIRNAESVYFPSEGDQLDTISLEMADSAFDPTLFGVIAGEIRSRYGTDAITSITNDQVTATGFGFHNVSRPNTPGIIKVEFTLEYINDSGRNEYDYSKTFTGSASLRPRP